MPGSGKTRVQAGANEVLSKLTPLMTQPSALFSGPAEAGNDARLP